MKTPLALLLGLAAALVLAAPAQAKEPTTATIWGAGGSVTLDDPAQIRLVPSDRPYTSVTEPPRLAPFYAIDVRDGVYRPVQHALMLWVPSARRAALVGVMGDVEWFPVGPARARMLDAAVADLAPYQPGRAWPRRLTSIEQISALAGASMASPGPAYGLPWTYVSAGIVSVVAACFLLVRRRFAAGAGSPRPV